MFFLVSIDLYAISLDVGGKLGAGVGWWRGSAYEKNVEPFGAPIALFGPYTSLEIHKYVALQFELLFSIIGNKDEIKYSTFTLERKFLNYAFEVPVYVKPKFEAGPGEVFFLFGPRFLILLDDFDVDVKTSIADVTVEAKSDYRVGRQFHLGITCGVGYDLKLGPGKLQFAINITPYLTNYGKDFDKAIQNEFYFDIGYAYTFKD
jgi:hypothetical protein